ncbi:MAG TPA: hypothetical protein DCO71_11200 [Gammaproteobacteria bacterium]|nr:hypothetical protein [Gammaproteobacteria bacterium]
MPDSLSEKVLQQFPVAVLVEYQAVHDNRWIDGRWVVTGVIAGAQFADDDVHSKLVHSSAAGQQYLWTGLSVTLHTDDTESYYCNLMSDKPSAFIICNEGQDEPLQPFIVTLSYGEATSYMETDVRVERVDIPAELYRHLEQYVLANHVPEKKKKRKRDNWKEAGRG